MQGKAGRQCLFEQVICPACRTELGENLYADELFFQALGVGLIACIEIVQIAHLAGYDALFIELEHSLLSLNATGQVCQAANRPGIAPFVRVPQTCGDGYI